VSPRFVHRRVVAFSETDAAGIVHFATFFRYMEDCEHAFLRSLGVSVHVAEPGGGFRGFPRVKAHCEYFRPLHFEDEVEVALFLEELRRRSIVYRFEVRRAGEEAAAAVGGTTVVCAGREGADGALASREIPAALREALERVDGF
jgi:acyl-CoA thioester hydrolase